MKRDATYDIMKATAIILMVMAHAGCASALHDFIYLFHMPFFFIIAGWFYKGSASENWRCVCSYAGKLGKRMLVPFIIFGGGLLLLHNILYRLHFYTDDSTIAGMLSGDSVSHYWSLNETVHHLLGTLVLQDGMGGLAGTFWFLRAMFFALAIYCLMNWAVTILANKFGLGVKARRAFLTITILISVLMVRYFLPSFIARILGYIGGKAMIYGLLFVHVGVLLRLFDWQMSALGKVKLIACAVLLFVGLIVMGCFGSVNLDRGAVPSVVFVIVSSLAGFYLLEAIARLIPCASANALAYLGRHTMPILLFHFLAFKIVSYFGVLILNRPIDEMAAFPYAFSGFFWCLSYTIVGVTAPLALDWIYLKIKNKGAC